MSATGYQGPDRVLTVNELMERGISYDESLRRIDSSDAVDDRGQALKDVVESVREYLCVSLDGPLEWADEPEFKVEKRNAVLKMLTAWREFEEAVGEAQRILGEENR
jgi:hypothetical protein